VSLFAGIDIGNATTEIVVADEAGRPVAWDRAPTRGVKGSARSGEAAARLLRRLERQIAAAVDLAVLTEQHPVRSEAIDVLPPPPDTGRLVLLASGAATPGGGGVGAGRPCPVERDPVADVDVVLVARDPLGYRATAAAVDAWLRTGARVRAVLLAGDEAVLVSTRISAPLPVVDGVDAEAALACDRVTVEVADAGQQVRHLSDPLAVAADLDLLPAEHPDAAAATSAVRGARAAVIGRRTEGPRTSAPDRAAASIPTGPPADDLATWSVDLATLGALPGLRPDAVARPSRVTASLGAADSDGGHAAAFAATWGGHVRMLSSEAAAGRRGALTSPGTTPETVVIDLGGGTIDLTTAVGSTTAAGSGALLTLAVADILGVSWGLAEWAKRGPSSRIEAPHLALRESGDRDFLEPPAAAGTVGWLVAAGPSGPVPVTRTLMPAEWRALRRAAKQAVVVDNLRRLLPPADRLEAVLVGGPAGDDELVEIVNAAVPGTITGRADVAGRLGHRWAVAYGLVLAGLDPIRA